MTDPTDPRPKPPRRVAQPLRVPTTKPRHPELEPLAVGIGDAARLLGIGLTAAKELVYSGAVHSVKIGDRRLVPIAAIRKFLGE